MATGLAAVATLLPPCLCQLACSCCWLACEGGHQMFRQQLNIC